MTRRSWIFLPGLAACGGKRNTADVEVRIAFTEGSWNSLPWRLAHSLGYFRELGLAIVPAGVPGSAKVMEALLGGSVEVGFTTMEHVVQLAVEDRSTPGFVNQFLGTTSPLVVSPKASRNIKTFSDLRGCTVGVSAIGSQTDIIAKYLFHTHALEPGAVSTVSIGFGAPSMAALERGLVDAGFVNYAGYVLLKRKYPGLIALFDPISSASILYPTGILCSPAGWLTNNRNTAGRIVTAMLRVLHYLHHATQEELAGHLPADLRSADPTVDLEVIRTLRPRYSLDGTFPVESLAAVQKIVAASMPKVAAANIDPRRVYTNELVKEAM